MTGLALKAAANWCYHPSKPFRIKCLFLLNTGQCFRNCAARSFEPNKTRVTKAVASVPRDIDAYFRDHAFRRSVWCITSLFFGYYSGNMVSLAFGALAINDVVAAVMTVAVADVISRRFYGQWPRPDLFTMFANFFKMGVTFAFMADAYKLGG
jgi:hypothetical protein